MKQLILFLLIFHCKLVANSSGFPVIDTNELAKQLQDSLYLIASLDVLTKEVLGSNVNVFAVDSLTREIYQLQSEISYYEKLNNGIYDLSRPSIDRSKVFVDQVNSLSRYIRKVKRVMTLIGMMKPRPEAVTATANVLKEQRQREKEKFELALRALEEREKIEKMRREVRRKVQFKQELENEMSIIGGRTKFKAIPVPLLVEKTQRKREGLW